MLMYWIEFDQPQQAVGEDDWYTRSKSSATR
jgi:hypothetical protein